MLIASRIGASTEAWLSRAPMRGLVWWCHQGSVLSAAAIEESDAAAAEVALPAGFDASEVFVQVVARGCAGSQSAAADVVVVDTSARR